MGDFNKLYWLMLRSNLKRTPLKTRWNAQADTLRRRVVVRNDRNAYVVELRVMVDLSSGEVDLRAVDTDAEISFASMHYSVRDW